MGKILDYIQQSSNGRYQCYKTKKLSLDTNNSDTVAYNYDDKSVVQVTKNVFAETDRSRQSVVSIKKLYENNTPPPIFSYFLEKLLLYRTDGFTEDKDKDFYKNRGVVKIPSLDFYRKNTDLGQGFYTTTSFEQLQTHRLFNQLSFHSQQVIDKLRFIEYKEIK